MTAETVIQAVPLPYKPVYSDASPIRALLMHSEIRVRSRSLKREALVLGIMGAVWESISSMEGDGRKQSQEKGIVRS